VSRLAALRNHLAGRVLLFLSATVLQALTAVAILPLTTIVLDAADFGYFALVMSWAALVSSFGDAGASLALPAHYGVASEAERRRMLSSFFLVSLLFSSGLAVLFWAAWPWLEQMMLGSAAPSRTAHFLTALLIPLKSVTILSTNIFSVAGRGNAVAAQIAAQALGTFVGTLIALFGFHQGLLSLFVGAVVGQACSVAIAVTALGAEPWRTPSYRWLSVLGSHSLPSLAAGTVGGLRSIGENSIVAASLNIATVGYLSHARLYFGMLLAATNAVALNVWSTSLAEARDPLRQFSTTRRIWLPIHILITLFGVAFSCFGEQLVAILTHDRLTPAARIVPWLAVLLLIHVSGRTQNATIYANGGAKSLINANSLISILCLAALPFAVGTMGGFGWNAGLTGVVAVLLTEAIWFRIYIYRKSSSFWKSGSFDDGWVVCGSAAIVLSWLFNAYTGPAVLTRIALCVIACVAPAVIERKKITDLLRILLNRSDLKQKTQDTT
jgi:O-antigen/teichoic acid export membrane protein